MSDKYWEKLPRETARGYSAFCVFRDQEPGERGLKKAADIFYGGRANSSQRRQMQKWASRFKWNERVGARDREIDRRVLEISDEERIAARTRRLRLARMQMELGEMALARHMQKPKVRAGIAAKLIEAGTKQERLELGEATDRQEVHGSMEHDHQSIIVEVIDDNRDNGGDPEHGSDGEPVKAVQRVPLPPSRRREPA